MLWILTVATLILAGCAAGTSLVRTGPLAGQNWEATNPTLQQYPEDANQMRWHYLLRLRDVSGAGLHLTRLTRTYQGVDFHGLAPQSSAIDLKIEPNGVLEIPCWETWFRRPGGYWVRVELQIKKRFAGRDGRGRTVTFDADLAFDFSAPPRPARLLEFARFTDREFTAVPQPHFCETAPNGIQVVDRAQAQKIHFLIGTGLVFRAVATRLRTRWISPSGDEVKVIESDLRPVGATSGMMFNMHATHSIPKELFHDRPGVWKVELSVDNHPEGVYTIRVI